MLTDVLGSGPAATVTALIPDLHCFCNRGAKDVIPLWRDSSASIPNITSGLLSTIGMGGEGIVPPALFAYCYALLSAPSYVEEFWEELTNPGPRIPITKDRNLFDKVVRHGENLIALHTFGDRVYGQPFNLSPGSAKCAVGTPGTVADYPESFSYDSANCRLRIGGGLFENVCPEVWNFSVSGFSVLQSWIAYRLKRRAGRRSSPRDNLRPEGWGFDDDLLTLLWTLESTIKLRSDSDGLLKAVLQSELWEAAELPKPAERERKPLATDEDGDAEEEPAQMGLYAEFECEDA